MFNSQRIVMYDKIKNNLYITFTEQVFFIKERTFVNFVEIKDVLTSLKYEF